MEQIGKEVMRQLARIRRLATEAGIATDLHDFEAQTGEPPTKVYRINPRGCAVCSGRGCEFCPTVELETAPIMVRCLYCNKTHAVKVGDTPCGDYDGNWIVEATGLPFVSKEVQR